MTGVTDAVCGMRIDTESAEAQLDLDGRTYYFCSTACRHLFEAQPKHYVGDGAGSAAHARQEVERHEPPYTVTGQVAAPKFGAAGSGGLEYELLPEAHDQERS